MARMRSDWRRFRLCSYPVVAVMGGQRDTLALWPRNESPSTPIGCAVCLVRDTRVTVSAVLGQLAAGANIDELLADYPCLEREDVLAALEYAAAAAQERELAVAVPAA